MLLLNYFAVNLRRKITHTFFIYKTFRKILFKKINFRQNQAAPFYTIYYFCHVSLESS